MKDHETVGKFLDLLEKDIAQHPEKLVPLSKELLDQAAALTSGMHIDLDAPIEGDIIL